MANKLALNKRVANFNLFSYHFDRGNQSVEELELEVESGILVHSAGQFIY